MSEWVNRLSRCNISSSGLFTIGIPSNEGLLKQTSSNDGFAMEDDIGVIPDINNTNITVDMNEQEKNQSSILISTQLEKPQTPVQPPEDFEEFANDGDFEYEPDPQDQQDLQDQDQDQYDQQENSKSSKKSPWDLVDPFDNSSNQVIPHSRGNIFLNKKEIQKKLAKFQDMSLSYQQTTAMQQRSDLIFHYPADEFFGFKYSWDEWMIYY